MLAVTGSALATALAGCSADDGSGTESDQPTDTPRRSPTDSPILTPTDESPDTPRSPGSDLVNGSFEDDWAGWMIGRHLPEDPNREGTQSVASEVGVTTEDASDGRTSCRIFIDGSQDDGTVWVQQPVDLSEYNHLAVDYLVSGSFNEILQAAVYTGPDPDGSLVEREFDRSNSLAGHAAQGWKTFIYEVTHDGPGVVAVGLNIVWETGAASRLDNVRLTIDEPSTITPSETDT